MRRDEQPEVVLRVGGGRGRFNVFASVGLVMALLKLKERFGGDAKCAFFPAFLRAPAVLISFTLQTTASRRKTTKRPCSASAVKTQTRRRSTRRSPPRRARATSAKRAAASAAA
jgi:hypothetical protein